MEDLADSVYIPQTFSYNYDSFGKDEEPRVGRSLPHESDTDKATELNLFVKDIHEFRDLQYLPGSVLCNICWKYIKADVFTDHIATRHSGQNNQHMCEDCGKSYRFERTLILHRAKHHSGTLQERSVVQSKVTCTVCQKIFDFKWRLVKHMMGHDQTSFFSHCVVCLEEFDVIKELQQHIESHNGDVLDCALCGLQLKGADDVLRHTAEHRLEEQRSLSENGIEENETTDTIQSVNGNKQADISADEQGGVNSDTQDGIGGNKSTCDVCGKFFLVASSLISHMKLHDNNHSLKCHRCFQTYNGIKALRLHMLSCDVPDPNADPPDAAPKKKRNQCDICLEMFLTYRGKQLHRLIHTGEPRAHECKVCGRRFLLSAELKKHSAFHLEVSPYVCDFCGRGFAMRQALRYHRMKHTGDKPCLCDICGKRFVSRKKLHLHTFVHTRETPFNCKVCGRGFRAFVTRQKHKCQGPPAEAPVEPQDSIIIKTEPNTLMADEIHVPESRMSDDLDSLGE